MQVVGRDAAANYEIAAAAGRAQIAAFRAPRTCTFTRWWITRNSTSTWTAARRGQLGLTQRDVTNSLLISLSSSGQVAPNAMAGLEQRRQLQRGRADAAVPDGLAGGADAHADFVAHCQAYSAPRRHRPRARPARGFAVGAAPARTRWPTAIPAPQPAARNLLEPGQRRRGVAPEIVNHYNVQPVFDIYANVDRRDLGSVARGGGEDRA